MKCIFFIINYFPCPRFSLIIKIGHHIDFSPRENGGSARTGPFPSLNFPLPEMGTDATHRGTKEIPNGPRTCSSPEASVSQIVTLLKDPQSTPAETHTLLPIPRKQRFLVAMGYGACAETSPGR